MITNKKDQIRKLLKGIETGDPESVTVVNEDKYIQHNPLTPEGSEGLAELFKRLSKTSCVAMKILATDPRRIYPEN